jgi:hypothetical protein
MLGYYYYNKTKVYPVIALRKVSSKCDGPIHDAELTVAWNPVSGAATYNIVHVTGETLASGITGTQYTFKGLDLGKLTIKVQALSSSGKVIAESPMMVMIVCSVPGDPCYPYFAC